MKKAMFLVLVMAMTIAGCSKEDTNTPVEPDPIVGTWYLVEEQQVIAGEVTIFPMSACEKKNNLVIKEDGIMLSTYYYRDENKCKLDGSEKIEWAKKEDGAYTFKYIQDDDILSEVILKEGTLTVVFTTTYNGVEKQYLEIYSRTPDESGNDEQIIGKWDHTATIEFINGEQQPIMELSDCETKSSIEFDADGSGTVEWYDNGNGGCIGGDPNPFTWTNKENNMYCLEASDETIDCKFTFQGKTMDMTITSIENGVEYVEIEKFIRIE